jgi:hypothetical protein
VESRVINAEMVVLFQVHMILDYMLWITVNNVSRKLSTEEIEAIGTAFAAETNRRDEDTEMSVALPAQYTIQ